MSANGNYIFPAAPLTVAQVIVGSGSLVALTAVAVLGIGTILRRSAGAILVGVVRVRPADLHRPGHHRPDRLRQCRDVAVPRHPGGRVLDARTPAAIRAVSYPYTMANGYYPLAPWAGLLVLCAYAAAALFGARIVLRRRDA